MKRIKFLYDGQLFHIVIGTTVVAIMRVFDGFTLGYDGAHCMLAETLFVRINKELTKVFHGGAVYEVSTAQLLAESQQTIYAEESLEDYIEEETARAHELYIDACANQTDFMNYDELLGAAADMGVTHDEIVGLDE